MSSSKALIETATYVGPGVVTGAVTTALAFFTAAFTEFVGIVELGYAHAAGRQRHAHIVFRRVLEREIHIDFLVALDAVRTIGHRAAAVAIGLRESVIDQRFLARHTVRRW